MASMPQLEVVVCSVCSRGGTPLGERWVGSDSLLGDEVSPTIPHSGGLEGDVSVPAGLGVLYCDRGSERLQGALDSKKAVFAKILQEASWHPQNSSTRKQVCGSRGGSTGSSSAFMSCSTSLWPMRQTGDCGLLSDGRPEASWNLIMLGIGIWSGEPTLSGSLAEMAC